MNHLSENNIKRLIKMIKKMKIKIRTTVRICEACLKRKQTHQSSHKSITRASVSLKLIHSDLCESIDSTIYDKTNYYILFIDDFIRMSHIYSLKRKSSIDVLEKFREYKLEMKKQIGKSIKRLRTNNDREYEKWMKNHLKRSDIIHETIASYNSNQNDIAKRANRMIIKRVK